MVEFGVIVVVEAQVAQAEHEAGLVQQSHHHLFAENRGQNAHADIHQLVLGLDGQAAVLGQAALGDVELADDLDAAHNARMAGNGNAHGLHEHAVDAVTHTQRVLLGLDMDVRGALLDGLGEHLIHQTHHRAVRHIALHLNARVLVVGVRVRHELHLGDGVVDFRRAPDFGVQTVHRLFNGALATQAGHHGHGHAALHAIQHGQVVRVRHGHHQGTALKTDGHHAVGLGEFLAHLDQGVLIRQQDTLAADPIHTQLFGQGFHQLIFADQVQVQQGLAHALGQEILADGLPDLLLVHKSLADQDLANFLKHG